MSPPSASSAALGATRSAQRSASSAVTRLQRVFIDTSELFPFTIMELGGILLGGPFVLATGTMPDSSVLSRWVVRAGHNARRRGDRLAHEQGSRRHLRERSSNVQGLHGLTGALLVRDAHEGPHPEHVDERPPAHSCEGEPVEDVQTCLTQVKIVRAAEPPQKVRNECTLLTRSYSLKNAA